MVSAKNLFITHTFGGGIASEEELPRVVVVPMPLASALELVLNQYDIFDVDTLIHSYPAVAGRRQPSG